jgi:hypothetical protein
MVAGWCNSCASLTVFPVFFFFSQWWLVPIFRSGLTPEQLQFAVKVSLRTEVTASAGFGQA